MNSGIYTITNNTNGHRYVGSSVDLKKRFRDHHHYLRNEKHDNSHLQRAWIKYGHLAFKFQILFYCDPEMCITFEQMAMDALRPEYNIAPIAGSCLGVKFGPHSEETRARMSEAQKGRVFSEEHRAKLSVAGKGHKVSEETLAKMKSRKVSKETKAKIGAVRRGRKLSDEHKANISAGVKAYWTALRAVQEAKCFS